MTTRESQMLQDGDGILRGTPAADEAVCPTMLKPLKLFSLIETAAFPPKEGKAEAKERERKHPAVALRPKGMGGAPSKVKADALRSVPPRCSFVPAAQLRIRGRHAENEGFERREKENLNEFDTLRITSNHFKIV